MVRKTRSLSSKEVKRHVVYQWRVQASPNFKDLDSQKKEWHAALHDFEKIATQPDTDAKKNINVAAAEAAGHRF